MDFVGVVVVLKLVLRLIMRLRLEMWVWVIWVVCGGKPWLKFKEWICRESRNKRENR
jgi:hypothetical protein